MERCIVTFHSHLAFKFVCGWSEEVSNLWVIEPESASRRRTLALISPGFTVIIDNVGWVGNCNELSELRSKIFSQLTNPRHMDHERKRGEYEKVKCSLKCNVFGRFHFDFDLQATQMLAVLNRVSTSHLRFH